ncbi:MAG: rod shape-determining protein RodA [Candidatus Magasanikbacteria bacterium]|jgi:rod shape determining protein RodA|nr:rod shape-determining protein RodA [Candidatus Magasanikbacteria bacterium]
MNFLRRIFTVLRSYDWFLTIVVLILMMIGLSAVYSVDLSKGTELTFVPRQLMSAAIALAVFFIAGSIHVSRYESLARIAYLGSLLALVGVLIFGVTVNGTRGWFRLAGFSFQPAEFAKVSLIFLMGWLIARQGRRFDEWQFVVSSGLATAFLGGLILLQPDLGSAAILFAIWFGLLYLTGAKKRYLLGLVMVFITLLVLGWMFFFQDYQRGRFMAFLDPETSEYGYNVRQSIIAIGAGQFYGRGLGFGSQSQLHFLPEAQTDFIFAVIGEELGFIGTSLLLVLYVLMCWRLIATAKLAKDDFDAYVVLGIALLFAVHLLINVGGATGMLPVTGVTLPFVSYGGSSLIINMFLLGVVQSVYRHAHHQY